MQCTAQPRGPVAAAAGASGRSHRCLAFSRSCSSSSSTRSNSSSSRQGVRPLQQQHQHRLPARIGGSRTSRQLAVTCRAADDRPPASSGGSGVAVKFNPVYLVITGAYAGLLVFKNPYIYAVLTVLTILPQNSNVTSLNNLVLLFYESGLFQNFAEAVNCVRLVTWLSMGFMVASFALFK